MGNLVVIHMSRLHIEYGWIIYIFTYPTNWQDLGCWQQF
jgi:hypothetical protein